MPSLLIHLPSFTVMWRLPRRRNNQREKSKYLSCKSISQLYLTITELWHVCSVIGPAGSGKTSVRWIGSAVWVTFKSYLQLINVAGGQPDRPTSKEPGLCTTEFCRSLLEVGPHKFTLVDSPGFDNARLSDCEIFVNMIKHLAPQTSVLVQMNSNHTSETFTL
jgi:hypothetical protein